MKRLLSPLVVTLSLLAGAGIAVAANKGAPTIAHLQLDSGGKAQYLTSVSGIGFTVKGAPNTKSAVPAGFAPVDVSFVVEPDSEGLTHVRAYLGGDATMDASLKLADQNQDIKQAIELGAASILELQLPGADPDDHKKAAKFRMRLQPERLSIAPGTGKLSVPAPKARSITEANFRVLVDGVAAPEILSVAPSVVRRSGSELQISGLGIGLNEAELMSGVWAKRITSALGSGKERSKEAKGAEMTLKIEYLDPALTKTLMSVEFSGVWIESLELPALTSPTEHIVEATLLLHARDVQIK